MDVAFSPRELSKDEANIALHQPFPASREPRCHRVRIPRVLILTSAIFLSQRRQFSYIFGP